MGVKATRLFWCGQLRNWQGSLPASGEIKFQVDEPMGALFDAEFHNFDSSGGWQRACARHPPFS